MGNFRVLLVEDNEDDEILGRRAIQIAINADVEVACTGLAALQILKRDLCVGSLPDLMVLDLRLPGMDGLELLQRVGENPEFADLRTIILTSSEDPKERKACLGMGAMAFISKPLDPDVFLEEIARSGKSRS